MEACRNSWLSTIHLYTHHTLTIIHTLTITHTLTPLPHLTWGTE